jgi:hypothetical protein
MNSFDAPATTLRTIGVFPMTHHVECVALLVPSAD